MVLHDLVFAPLRVRRFAGRRLVLHLVDGGRRSRWRFAAWCWCSGDPGIPQAGIAADNLTVLDRTLGWISLAIVWACVPLYYLAMRLLPVRENQVVEHQRADDVEGQPPAV